MNCRNCGAPLECTVLDLGFAPLSNSYLSKEDLNRPELYLPLKIQVCDQCWLVQTEDYSKPDDLFTAEYAYFSSTSSSWLAHAKSYSEKVIKELGLNSESHVVEVASNDGYLLRNFLAAGIPCLGIEPTNSTADAAEKLGVPVIREFFGQALSKRLVEKNKQADLIVGNNVYAHLPDIIDFTKALKILLKPGGTITLEFPHLMKLIEQAQFDTIYHEHFSYLSLDVVRRIFVAAGLRIWNVEELNTHGGSLRVYGCHEEDVRETLKSVDVMLLKEKKYGLQCLETYLDFQKRAEAIKDNFLLFLIDQKRNGKTVAAYGAAAKGNTLLNYAGVKSDLISFVCDAAKAKQGKFMPGSHIPILPPSHLEKIQVDFLVIFPWNIAEEVKLQNVALKKSGTKFVTVLPTLHIS
jgi:SAM-dependent methyltransferase